jgi:hypothetical protein
MNESRVHNFSNIKENKEGIQKEINDKIYDEKKK